MKNPIKPIAIDEGWSDIGWGGISGGDNDIISREYDI